jgi:hypothetical protein
VFATTIEKSKIVLDKALLDKLIFGREAKFSEKGAIFS